MIQFLRMIIKYKAKLELVNFLKRSRKCRTTDENYCRAEGRFLGMVKALEYRYRAASHCTRHN